MSAGVCVVVGGVLELVTAMTSVADGLEHAIADSEFVPSRHGGRYRAVCGHLVVPGSMSAPPGRPCPPCVARLRWRPTVATARRRRRFLPGLRARSSRPGG
uniref:hypothetical protein n=1 Tax=Pseudonocardia sp. CA-138482 TaxID=3240023 RepID=UPI003F4999E9